MSAKCQKRTLAQLVQPLAHPPIFNFERDKPRPKETRRLRLSVNALFRAGTQHSLLA
jgi:hypothetical protein